MKLAVIVTLLAAIAARTSAQQPGTTTQELHPPLPSKRCTVKGGCISESTKVVLDVNWRWMHKTGDTSKNCNSGGKWDSSFCADGATCAKNCAVEGVDKYQENYGVSTSGSELALKLVTTTASGTTVGSRLYLLADDSKYKVFYLLNQEFSFDLDISQIPCGVDASVYFAQMDADGGKGKYPSNAAGAAYGTGYCDAQCTRDVKFINGEANIASGGASGRYGACCSEMDIFEANKMSGSFTSHPCEGDGSQIRCTSDAQCGTGSANHYKGVCDMDGCDDNSFRLGNHNFYGPGSNFQVDTTKPFTVITQFITSDKTANGDLVEIKRLFKQNGKVIENPKINVTGMDAVTSLTDKMCAQERAAFKETDDHTAKGGLKQMTKALKKGMVLTMSMWTDEAYHCLWLDSSLPLDRSPSEPGVMRGTCPTTSGVPSEVQAQYPDATVKYSNVRVGEIGSTYL
ncbi:putative 1,4-beta-d-glucan cellobiohydrolase b [Globisporangium polare]